MPPRLPDLDCPNLTGSCWTCIDAGHDDDCDRTLPFCNRCAENNTHCDGYTARMKWNRPAFHRSHRNKTPRLLKAISSLGLSPKEDRFLLHFAKNLARISLAVDYEGNGFRRLSAVACNDAALLAAILALSVSHLSRWQAGGGHDYGVPMTYVRQSMGHLQKRLMKPSMAKSETTLMTMLMLLTFELCYGGENWSIHYQGILSWFRARSDYSTIDPFLISIFAMQSTLVLVHNPQTLLHDQSYQLLKDLTGAPAPNNNNNKVEATVVDVVFGCSVDHPRLMVEAAALQREAQRAQLVPNNTETLLDIHVRAELLAAKLRDAAPSCTTPEFSLTGRGSTPAAPAEDTLLEIAELHRSAHASSEVFRLAIRILTYRITHDPAAAPVLPPGFAAEVLEPAFAHHLPLIAETVGTGIFLGWALVVIGSEVVELDRREYVARRLRSLELLALNQGTMSLRVLREVWARRDRVVLGTLASRKGRCRWQEVMQDWGMEDKQLI